MRAEQLPKDALLCEPCEVKLVFQPHYYCPFCHRLWVNLSFLGLATDSYVVDGFGLVRRGFVSLDPAIKACSCGLFWLNDPEPFHFSVIAAEVHNEKEIQKAFEASALH